ncbi:TolC family protein [Shewanella colwelliana]|nr:TolC family protein [Shewanella colwelliana]
MKRSIIATLMLGYFCSASVYAQSISIPSTIDNAMAYSSLAQQSANSEAFALWLQPLMRQFNQLPEVKALQAKAGQAQLLIQAADKAIYNPELGINYQNATEDTYSLDISQTIDWGDKRGVAMRKAQLEAEVLLSQTTLMRSQMLADVVMALVEQAQQNKILEFQQQQLDVAKQQFEIAKQQLASGAISQAELQLIQLDLASRAAEYALVEQAAINADAKVLMLFGTTTLPFNDFIEVLNVEVAAEVSPELPALKSAYQQVMMAKLAAKQVKADTSANPTISLSAEREGEENKLGVGLSIPIQIRNNYSETLAMASNDIAIAEQRYLASERVITEQQKLFYLSLPRLQQRYQEWRELVLTSGAGVADALGQQWQAGDISTSNYLQSKRQLASSYLAGMSLESALYQSWLDWMGQSGQLENYFLQQLAQQANDQSVRANVTSTNGNSINAASINQIR